MLFPFFALWVLLLPCIAAEKVLKASSLLTCMDNSQLWASYLDVVYWPQNKTVSFDIEAISNINNVNVSVNVSLIAYGINAIKQTIDLCSLKEYSALCPLTLGHLDINFDYEVSDLITKQIPGVAYTIPDLDARVRILMYQTNTDTALACVEATVSNGKTVQTKYAAWPIAAISGFGLITSGVVSVIGHSSTAAHIALNSMSLFVYFQSVAITSMLAVAKVPPIAAAWAQNFQWSLGVIKVGFVQNIANWYLQATGGEPTAILSNSQVSVSVQKVKRSLEYLGSALVTPLKDGRLQKRLSINVDSDSSTQSDNLDNTLYTTDERTALLGTRVLILRGIQRVAYMARIEITDLFMTAMMFLIFFAFILIVSMTFFKAFVEICIRTKMMNEGKFNEYRQHWSSIIKGALYRLLLVALPQIVVFSFWEFTVRDSAGLVVVAAFFVLVAFVLLGFAAFRVISFGRRSVREHKNPAYLLYGNNVFLNKFGFVYVQYRANCYYFVGFSLLYIFLKTFFVAVLQKHGKVQSLVVFAIELVHCVAVCWIRPFMDKRTNAFNITISVINTLNALFFAFFSYVFRQPEIVASVMAVVFFVLNAIFALFLLIFTIVTCVLALIYKNPDSRYQPMKDDRVSFLPRMGAKNGPKTATDTDDIELAALGASAMKGHEHAKESAFGDSSDEDSRGNGAAYRPVYDSESLSKQSLVDSVEPQQPASTITGNSSLAYQNFKTAYSERANHGNGTYNGYHDRLPTAGQNQAYNRNYANQDYI
ncbi:ML-like domain-containing protein [Metschnikowia aff. pulcherrima]|uniref:ML-like domain-containing protein n=1 Tax=Metschnikowia aff. pulcherrima TaxID=2163413 RepID=A0A4P6XUT0_9ASCO|nr:ML-like domain-containing protein [Metschnikowia aff. pulcherrima]